MKKAMTLLLTAVMMVSIGATTAFAASKGLGKNYVDLNNDSICDNSRFVDSDDDGICDNYPRDRIRPQDGTGRKSGRVTALVRRANYVDADQNGVCDNYMENYIRPQDGTGRKLGNAAISVSCTNYVDADGDGICDNCPNNGIRPQDGTGNRYGRGYEKKQITQITGKMFYAQRRRS